MAALVIGYVIIYIITPPGPPINPIQPPEPHMHPWDNMIDD